MNKAIFLFSVVIAAGGGYWLGKNNIPDNTVSSAVFIEPENIVHPTVVNLSQTNIERDFQQSIALANETELSSTPQKSTVVEQSTRRQIDAIKTEYELKQRSESFTNWFIKNQETKPWFDIGIAMRGRFDAEEVDHDWASTEESHLRSIFTQEQALAGIAVKSTVCRSTQCQITIGVIDHDHANETSMAIIEALSAEKFSHIIIDSQVKQGETIFYVSSNEKGFELNQ